MTINWNRESIDSMLEAIEYIAQMEGNIASESELSELFDKEIAPLVIAEYGEDDSVAMREEFGNWMDGICKDGIIHPEQYDKYCYVGKWAD